MCSNNPPLLPTGLSGPYQYIKRFIVEQILTLAVKSKPDIMPQVAISDNYTHKYL